MNSTKVKRGLMRAMLVIACMSGTVFDANCATAWTIFRGAASQDIGDGLKTILGGVVDGLVAVVDPTDTTKTGTSTRVFGQ